jgi:lysozyme
MGNAYIVLGVLVLVGAFLYRDELAQVAQSAAVNVRDYIKSLEGFTSEPVVDDDSKTPQLERSVGYGHQLTGREKTSDPEALLDQDIADAEAAVARLVVVALTANQRAALTSLVYNIGVGRFASSTLLRRLNAGDYVGAAAEFDRWVYSSGKVTPGLVTRRASERQLFTS